MGQAARDPLFHACLAVANQDAAFAGDLCIRCHTPGGWISGRSEPTDGGTRLTVEDEITFKGLAKLAAPLAFRDVRRRWARSLERLRGAAEASG